MYDFIKHIENKNTIITSAPGEGSTNLAYLITHELAIKGKIVLFFDTGHTLNRTYIKEHYFAMYNFSFIIQGSLDIFINYLTDMNRILSYIDYVVIDTGDILSKKHLLTLYNLFDSCNIKVICTSQLRLNPNTSKPYSTVEEWNKQSSELPFDNSIWIRKVNEPNKILNRKYIDIYNNFRIGNKYYSRSLISIDKKRGNIL